MRSLTSNNILRRGDDSDSMMQAHAHTHARTHARTRAHTGEKSDSMMLINSGFVHCVLSVSYTHLTLPTILLV